MVEIGVLILWSHFHDVASEACDDVCTLKMRCAMEERGCEGVDGTNIAAHSRMCRHCAEERKNVYERIRRRTLKKVV